MRKKAKDVHDWLVISSSGTCHAVEATKHEIMRRTCLSARDLRIMDPQLSHSTIMGRERAVVIVLEHIKVIISAQQVFVLNFKDPQVVPFIEALQHRLRLPGGDKGSRQTVSPFEFRAMEACLEAACNNLEDETTTLVQQAYPALDELTSTISAHNLDRLRLIKSQLANITGRVQKVRDEVEQLLDDDGDMAEMYLTRKMSAEGSAMVFSQDKQNAEDLDQLEAAAGQGKNVDVQELEMLLEAYFVQIDGTLHKIATLRDYVDATGDYLNLMLDDKQNQLLEMSVMFTAATLVVSASVVLTGIFGMNIEITWFQDSQFSTATHLAHFMWVTAGSAVGLLLLYSVFIAWCKWQKLLA